ncbi:MAG TPA: hypothetical protein VIE86_05235 [Nitrososphaera sp.]
MKCAVHTDFFDDSCPACKQEYLDMKGLNGSDVQADPGKKYKEFTEERAKKLYEELLLQYLKGGTGEIEAAAKAKAIIKKQCSIRGLAFWPWL